MSTPSQALEELRFKIQTAMLFSAPDALSVPQLRKMIDAVVRAVETTKVEEKDWSDYLPEGILALPIRTLEEWLTDAAQGGLPSLVAKIRAEVRAYHEGEG